MEEAQDRQPSVFLICGETGVGKTYRNKQEIRKYMQDFPSTGKKGRKVLAFDTNDDDYPEYRTISPEHLGRFKHITARRIRPFHPNGKPMDEDEKKEIVEKIVSTYRDGLLVLDDVDEYMTGAKGQKMIGTLCTIRHKNIDLIFNHQSVAKITTTQWQACTFLRLHHQVDDITRYRDRVPKYKVVRIAQNIVDEQYEAACLAYSKGKISKQEFRKQKSFFVYVNMREQKIQGCSKAAFVRACKKYINQEENKTVKMMLLERDFKERPKYKSRNEAVLKLLTVYMRFYEPYGVSPFGYDVG